MHFTSGLSQRQLRCRCWNRPSHPPPQPQGHPAWSAPKLPLQGEFNWTRHWSSYLHQWGRSNTEGKAEAATNTVLGQIKRPYHMQG